MIQHITPKNVSREQAVLDKLNTLMQKVEHIARVQTRLETRVCVLIEHLGGSAKIETKANQ